MRRRMGRRKGKKESEAQAIGWEEDGIEVTLRQRLALAIPVLALPKALALHCLQKGPYFKDLVLNKDLFGILGPYWVLIYISGSLLLL